MKYDQFVKDEWYRLKLDGWKHCCCDCGLVHKVYFKIINKSNLEARFERDERATGQIRRYLNKSKD